MELDSIPDALQNKIRIGIIASLMGGTRDFNYLKSTLKITAGNLSVQLSKLEGYGYIIFDKTIDGKRTHTFYSLTDLGNNIFVEYITMLEKLHN